MSSLTRPVVLLAAAICIGGLLAELVPAGEPAPQPMAVHVQQPTVAHVAPCPQPQAASVRYETRQETVMVPTQVRKEIEVPVTRTVMVPTKQTATRTVMVPKTETYERTVMVPKEVQETVTKTVCETVMVPKTVERKVAIRCIEEPVATDCVECTPVATQAICTCTTCTCTVDAVPVTVERVKLRDRLKERFSSRRNSLGLSADEMTAL